jgi:hypothetical protein
MVGHGQLLVSKATAELEELVVRPRLASLGAPSSTLIPTHWHLDFRTRRSRGER